MSKRKPSVSVKNNNNQQAQYKEKCIQLKHITPLTKNQEKLKNLYYDDYIKCIAAVGSAGSGKTLMSLSLALEDVLIERLYDKIIIIRSALQSRDIGHMPGDLKEKQQYYEMPYMDIVTFLTDDKDAYRKLKGNGQIEFMSTSFVRGLTFDNAIVIFDEVQNCNYKEIMTILTRVGENSKIIMCGDKKQSDMEVGGKNKFDKSGIDQIINVLNRVSSFGHVKFTTNDILRSGFVKELIIAEEELELGYSN